ncbi:hypothetical protein ColLi_00925 [Colletotrichum liriopes]|uniref:Uncharacterized protein n=1 Tax=Colletotrichum liriopes TaxID=708192 RepID=A0AA37LNG9_9PEZI|nr:hypothetical protein ColLi_00925 [Colletotrichum liriopes]
MENVACADVLKELGQTLGLACTLSGIKVNRPWELVFEGHRTASRSIDDLMQLASGSDDALMLQCGAWSQVLPPIASNIYLPNRLVGALAYVRFGRATRHLKLRLAFCESWSQEAPGHLAAHDSPKPHHRQLACAAFKFD